MGKMIENYDFLANLFKTNPQAHHEWHAEVIEEYIASLPPDRAEKMRTFQDTIVGEMNKCESTDERNQRMNEMFWEQTSVFTKTFDRLNRILK